MDVFDDKLSNIISKIQNSTLSDQEKADAYAALHVGLHKLVWPILLSHIPEAELKQATDNPKDWTMDRYASLINKSLADPSTPKELYNELMGAIDEVASLTAFKSL